MHHDAELRKHASELIALHPREQYPHHTLGGDLFFERTVYHIAFDGDARRAERCFVHVEQCRRIREKEVLPDSKPGVFLDLGCPKGKVDPRRALGEDRPQELLALGCVICDWCGPLLLFDRCGALGPQPCEPCAHLGNLPLHARQTAEGVQGGEGVGFLGGKLRKPFRGRGQQRGGELRVHTGVLDMYLGGIGQREDILSIGQDVRELPDDLSVYHVRSDVKPLVRMGGGGTRQAARVERARDALVPVVRQPSAALRADREATFQETARMLGVGGIAARRAIVEAAGLGKHGLHPLEKLCRDDGRDRSFRDGIGLILPALVVAQAILPVPGLCHHMRVWVLL